MKFTKGFYVKTLIIDIQDNFVQEFLTFIQSNKNNIKLHNIAQEDLYFNKRKEQLHHIKKQIDSNTANLSTLDEFEIKLNSFEKELELKYVN